MADAASSPAATPSSPAATLTTASKVSALAGVGGLAYGGVTGVLRGRHPIIRSVAQGISWSVFGAGFWCLRDAALTYALPPDPSPAKRAAASALAAGVAGGATTYALISRRFLPAFVLLSAGGFLGQYAYDGIDSWQLRRREAAAAEGGRKKPLEQRLLESKWTLLKPLGDAEYVEILEDRRARVEVEIALVEERMAELRGRVGAEGEGGVEGV